MRVTSDKNKKAQFRGCGEGASYKPWIMACEINSTGTTANIIDWKHGRAVQLLSAGEEMYYYDLRWDDAVLDIREQFPLDDEVTRRIAALYGIRHPRGAMTTDFLVSYLNNCYVAYSIKATRTDVDFDLSRTDEERKKAIRTSEKLFIEKCYWKTLGVEWRLVYKEDLDPLYISNIRRAVFYYDKSRVHDDVSEIKHLIATKQISVDLHSRLDYEDLIAQYL